MENLVLACLAGAMGGLLGALAAWLCDWLEEKYPWPPISRR